MNEQSGCSGGCWPPSVCNGRHTTVSTLLSVPQLCHLQRVCVLMTKQTWAVYRHLREDGEEAEKRGLLFTGAWLGNEMVWWGGVFNVFQASPTSATSGAVCIGNPFIHSRDKDSNVTQWKMKGTVTEMAQEVEVRTAKPDVLSSIPGIHIVEWENQSQQIHALWPLTYTDTQASKRVKIYKAKKAWEIIEDSPLKTRLHEA